MKIRVKSSNGKIRLVDGDLYRKPDGEPFARVPGYRRLLVVVEKDAMGNIYGMDDVALAAASMGRIKSTKKASAARTNGKKGGRPNKKGGAG